MFTENAYSTGTALERLNNWCAHIDILKWCSQKWSASGKHLAGALPRHKAGMGRPSPLLLQEPTRVSKTVTNNGGLQNIQIMTNNRQFTSPCKSCKTCSRERTHAGSSNKFAVSIILQKTRVNHSVAMTTLQKHRHWPTLSLAKLLLCHHCAIFSGTGKSWLV